MTSNDDELLPLHTSRNLEASGVPSWSQSQGSRDGTLERVRRGVYMNAGEWNDLDARRRFIARAQATTLSRPKPLVFSHVTAGILHGLPLLGPLPDRLDVLMHGVNGGRSEPGILSHRSNDVAAPVEVRSVLATNLDRTLVDVAATSSLRRSLVMLDSALHSQRTTPEALLAELTGRSSLRNRARAGRLLSLADNRAESVAESFSRAHMIETGFELPELQAELDLPDGRHPRVDCYWRKLKLIGECDGFVKYGRRGVEVDVDELWREKRREDALRAAGYRVIRWVWDDIWRGDPLTRLLLRAGVPRR
ncbi:hypothetical protein [Frondihabitans sp. VKM Ac-2883]|uniref:hypothetical protein n=1 Tax=Frondihabitans sp. VKM Ac-2883 TaxID=2783823 RepID=UPI00188B2E75|nr:hypothetical protein [Frondihabitans sp. VKM Ac-2883]MBF4574766.1 hypothetical protein [Frondihabitans sp. VKM Ac-2883]